MSLTLLNTCPESGLRRGECWCEDCQEHRDEIQEIKDVLMDRERIEPRLREALKGHIDRLERML